MDRKFNVEEFEQRNKEFLERKKKRIAYLQEEKFYKDVEECTFTPNYVGKSKNTNSATQKGAVTKSSSTSRLHCAGGSNPSRLQRNTRQFLDDQQKKEEERLMKISLQLELN
jgi:hypothetical protein